ncbi:MAG: EBNA-1 nuclear protein [Deltaproteobacteria bacterium]|nr:EBNA-1 nuclear protein [Deltaproteobacteria bacterium]
MLEIILPTAVIYCENNFSKVDGKTANGLIRYSKGFLITSVIDSSKKGLDSGLVLDNKINHIPIFENLREAVNNEIKIPDTMIYGMAPTNGRFSIIDKKVILQAIKLGMNIISGLHEYLCNDSQIMKAAEISKVKLFDMRKPIPSKDMVVFTGSVADTSEIRIAILGTDCAIGKRTTATILEESLNKRGIKTILINTGQTGLIQGGRYGIALDSVPSQFCCGELEKVIIQASLTEKPQVILVEGQGALSHPAFCTSAFILRGSQPHAVILQHSPKRIFRCDFPNMLMPNPADEISLIEKFANTKVIGLTLNHEEMTDDEITRAIIDYASQLRLPITDALRSPVAKLVDIVLDAFPQLKNPSLAAQ